MAVYEGWPLVRVAVYRGTTVLRVNSLEVDPEIFQWGREHIIVQFFHGPDFVQVCYISMMLYIMLHFKEC